MLWACTMVLAAACAPSKDHRKPSSNVKQSSQTKPESDGVVWITVDDADDSRFSLIPPDATSHKYGWLSDAVINDVISSHDDAIRECYSQRPETRHDLEGKLDLYFVINTMGDVSSAKITSSTVQRAPELEACVIDEVLNWTFPAPKGTGTVPVTKTYVFAASHGIE